MSTSSISALDSTMQKTNIWLKELAAQGHFLDEGQAYTALRAVLHALRDRLTIAEGADLSAQLPMLVRGIYYEGWKPSLVPKKERTQQEFYDAVAEGLEGSDLDPVRVTNAVFEFLTAKITHGEIEDIKAMLPADLRAVWP